MDFFSRKILKTIFHKCVSLEKCFCENLGEYYAMNGETTQSVCTCIMIIGLWNLARFYQIC